MTADVDVFLDTNVLLYSATGRSADPEKYVIAQGLLTANFGTSTQVLAEFYTNAIRKGSRPLSEEKASEWVKTLMRRPCQPVDEHIVTSGIQISQRFKIAYWDAAIIAAAAQLGATTLYSEDLSHGQAYGDVRVCNPFIEDFLKQD